MMSNITHAAEPSLTNEWEWKQFWYNQLPSGEKDIASLVLDYVSPDGPIIQDASIEFHIALDVHEQLNKLSNGNRFSLYVQLLTALKITLYQITACQQVIVGNPCLKSTGDVATRSNIVPIVTQINPILSFRQTSSKIRQNLIDSHERQDYPFNDMLSDMGITAGNRCSLFDIAVVMDDIHGTLPEVNHAITFKIVSDADALQIKISYASTLFRRDSIARLQFHFVTLLETALVNIDFAISDLSMLMQLEIHDTIAGASPSTPISTLTLAQLFQEQAKSTPDVVAFICDNTHITYRHLDARSNQVAHFLKLQGVLQETLIAVCVERSIDAIVVILGILKVGGVFVPIDPRLPAGRRIEMLDDVNPPLLVVERTFDCFENYQGRKLVWDDEWSNVQLQSKQAYPVASIPENLLAVFHTSASTGKAKGVLITILAAVHRLTWMWRQYPFTEDNLLVWYKSTSLIGSIWECYGALLQGQPTLIVNQQAVQDPSIFYAVLSRNKVTHLFASPVILNMVLDQIESKGNHLNSLRLAASSAEPLMPSLVLRWMTLFPTTPLLNLYGSTECSSNVMVYDTSQMPTNLARVPIGTPVSNVSIHILDKELRPVPYGSVGEMYISGVCLARGYFGDAKQTAARFLPDPFAKGPGKLMYHTGDMVRYGFDGNIELIGRRDHQVKIRGFRVELGEVETILLLHPNVSECVVIYRADQEVGGWLDAYIVCNQATSPSELRNYLVERLPSYMVPNHFILLDTLPRTPAGKIARHALPLSANAVKHSAKRGSSSVINEIETIISAVVSEVLQINKEDIGLDDNFTEAGLHSLRMIQVQHKLSQRLKVDLPILDLLKHPTIRSLSLYFRQGQTVEHTSDTMQIQHRAQQRQLMRQQNTRPRLRR